MTGKNRQAGGAGNGFAEQGLVDDRGAFARKAGGLGGGMAGRLAAIAAMIAMAGAFAFAGMTEAQAGNAVGRLKSRVIAITVNDVTECDSGSTAIPPGTIEVGLDHAQCFTYTYSGPNIAALRGAFGLDEISSDFNMSPEAEDEANGCDDGVCDGVKVLAGACDVYLSQPDSSVKNNDGAIPAKQPEILVYDLADSGNTSCSVQHWVKTVGSPGHVTQDANKDPQCLYPNGDGNGIGPGGTGDCDPDNPNDQIVLYDVFEPAKCTPLRMYTRDPDFPLDGIITSTGGDNLPINDYVRVNLGPKGFNALGLIFDNNNDFVIDLPSVQLMPIGCDTDGDGVADVADPDPLDPSVF